MSTHTSTCTMLTLSPLLHSMHDASSENSLAMCAVQTWDNVPEAFQGQDGFSDIRGKPHQPKLIHYTCCICLLLKSPERSGCLVYFHSLTANYLQTPHLQETPTFSTLFIKSWLIKVASKFACPCCQILPVDWENNSTKISHIIMAQCFLACAEAGTICFRNIIIYTLCCPCVKQVGSQCCLHNSNDWLHLVDLYLMIKYICL